MEISCVVCGKKRKVDATAFAKITVAIYRCRPCFLAASGVRLRVCGVCGKETKLPKREVARNKTDMCGECYLAERRKRRKVLTCPRCGKTRSVVLSRVWETSEGYCRSCAGVYDATLPDTYDAGYVTGVMMGDGSFGTTETTLRSGNGTSTGYFLRLEVTSEAFAKKFLEVAGRCTGNAGWMGGPYEYTKKANAAIGMPECVSRTWVVVVGSREWYEKLQPIKSAADWERLRGIGAEFGRGFVDGMIDSEGYVCETYTDVANKDVGLLGLVAEYLKSMGHRARVYKPYPYARGVAHLRVREPLRKVE